MAEQTPTTPPPIGHEERRNNLRRLDDVLEALEQLNLHDQTELNDALARRLVEVGIKQPYDFTVTQLIEKVWGIQQPFLVKVVVERRRRRRRRMPIDLLSSTP
ncbi:MAG TPA: hypothetical protein VF160_02495 [Candidatus Dormibacteraeota bacterium]